MLMLTRHFLLLLDINGIQMAKGGFYCEAAGDATYFHAATVSADGNKTGTRRSQ